MKLFQLVTFPIPTLSLLLLLLVVLLSPVQARAFSGVSTRRNLPIKVDVSTSTMHMFDKYQSSSGIGAKRTMLSLRGGQQTDEDDTVMTTDESVRQDSYGSIDEEEVEMIESQQHQVLDDSTITSSGSSISPSSPMTMIVTPIATVLRSATSFYSQQLKTSPILTKSLTAGMYHFIS